MRADLGDNRFVRRWCLWIVWCVSLALPLQGLAAAAPLLPLGSMHQMSGGVSTDAPAPCHAQSDADGAAPMHASSHDAAPGDHVGCVQCTVCHAGSAPAPFTAPLPGPLTHGVMPPAWQPPIPGTVDLAGLDRPPRTRLV